MIAIELNPMIANNAKLRYEGCIKRAERSKFDSFSRIQLKWTAQKGRPDFQKS